MTSPRRPSARAWLTTALLATLTVVLTLALALAAAGAMQHRPGDWRVTLVQFGARRIDVNVEALLRFATSPTGLRLLDGRSRASRFGTLRARRDGDTLVLRCAPCSVDHPQLSIDPVRFDALELRLRRRTDGLYEGTLVADDVRISWAARWEARGEARADAGGIALRWTLDTTPLAAIVGALRHALPEARMAEVSGTVRAGGRLSLPQGTATMQLQVQDVAVAGLGTERLRYGRFAFRCTTDAGQPHWASTGDGERGWIPLDRLGRHLPAAVIAAEDQRFAQHAGIDEVEIARVLARFSLRNGGEAVRGASTLTQQLARTLFTGGERTALRKLRETLYALEMERTLGKPRIMELYLNTVDWGPGICGARAAARTYFGKLPAQLDPLSAAWLAAILRHPLRSWREEFVGRQVDVASAQRVLAQQRDLTRRERAHWSQRDLTLAAPDQAARQRAGKAMAALSASAP